mgnify:CR=1 FL=1
MKSDEQDAVIERLLAGLQPPTPPQELRSSVLATARQRMGTETALDVWSRLWNHNGLRLAWAASVVLLLAGHVLVNTGKETATDPDLYAENRVDEYLVEMLRPIRISDNVRPIVGFNVDSNGLTDLELEGNPS